MTFTLRRCFRFFGYGIGVALVTVTHTGCSLQELAAGALSSSLAQGAAVFAADEDPEFVRDALPFALKTYEMLLRTTPDDPDLLLATCSGFTQYAKAFLEEDAFYAAAEDYAAAERLKTRALRMYLRARDYCLQALELEAQVDLNALTSDPDAALSAVPVAAVPILFWTGAAWGSAIGVGLDRPELVVDLPVVRDIFERCNELDPAYDRAGIEEALMALESVPELFGGSLERAHVHFENAIAATGGTTLSPYVSWASSVSVANQDRAEFERMLEAALAIDVTANPANRLANELMLLRAKYLQQHSEEYFIE